MRWRASWILVLAVPGACGGPSGGGDSGGSPREVAGDVVEAAPRDERMDEPALEVGPEGAVEACDDAAERGAIEDAPGDHEGEEAPGMAEDALETTAETDTSGPLPEWVVDWPPPGSEGRTLIANDEGTESVEVPSAGDFTTVVEGLAYRFRPYVRFRLPHPGRVTRVFVYTAGGAGALGLHLSSGFPGGHYPCLDEETGSDPDQVGPDYRMAVSDQPGWRAFDVGPSGLEVGGYDEFFVLFDLEGEARVGLAPAAPKPAGDYESYAGLIADVPGDGMACFPTLSSFSGTGGEPRVWLVRAEVEGPDEVSPRFEPADSGPAGAGHAAFGDVDRDGDDDLLTGGALWINDGTGRFEDRTEAAGLSGVGGETVFGDFDNDGSPDVLAVGSQARLFRNLGDATFAEVTQAAGVAIPANSQGVVWMDFDADGLLDFYAASYGTLADPEVPERDFLFRNRGDGTFEDVTGAMGMPVDKPRYHGRGVAAADHDADGDLDLYVGNYRLDPNQLWRNRGGLAGFDEVGGQAGVQGDWNLYGYGHTIGPGFADLDGDARPDLLVPNLAHPRFLSFSDRTTLYRNRGDGTFEAIRTPDAGIAYDETHSHAVLADFDADGDVDVYLTAVYPGRRAFLYDNDGQGRFRDGTWEAGILHLNGWGAAASDVDGDGDMDLAAGRVWLNRTAPGGHVLRVRVEGGARPGDAAGWSNRDAVGAVIVAEADGRTLWRQVEGGTGTGCQNTRVLHLGLGAADRVDRLTVHWPSGRATVIEDVPAGQVLEVSEREESGPNPPSISAIL